MNEETCTRTKIKETVAARNLLRLFVAAEKMEGSDGRG